MVAQHILSLTVPQLELKVGFCLCAELCGNEAADFEETSFVYKQPSAFALPALSLLAALQGGCVSFQKLATNVCLPVDQ